MRGAMPHIPFVRIWMLVMSVLAVVSSSAVGAARPDVHGIVVFDQVEISFDADLVNPQAVDNHVVLRNGQVVQRTIDLPAQPKNLRNARRIIAHITVEPILNERNGKLRPGDPWTRMGSISLVKPGADLMPKSIDPNTIEDDSDLPSPEDDEIELVRFITGFGGAATYEQDLTTLAPLLADTQTIRLYLSTWLDPGWRVSLTLQYIGSEAGPRRPVFAQHLFNDQSVEAADTTLRTTVTVPHGLATPRIRILSTGHATDGADGDEFTARTNVLRIDGKAVAMFRPWTENGGDLRNVNPTSGRITIEGRSLWSSDLDRAGWHPGMVVQTHMIPVPELTPGEHTIELSVLDIRPEDENGELGYWRVSAILVADEPWPESSEINE